MEISKKETINYQLHILDKQFKNNTNLDKYIEECQNFYNGKQYPNANYKNMPRATMNVCSFSSNIKASKLCGNLPYITFTASNRQDTTPLQRFDEYNQSKLKEQTNNFQSALNGFNNGTEICYIRWDEDDTSYQGIYKGGLVYEHIDPRNFAVANPEIEDLQNQKYVMFHKNVEIAAVRELLEGSEEEIKEKNKYLLPNDYDVKESFYKENSQNINHALITMFTRFFKIDGEVYFMCSTKYVDIFEYPHAMNPEVNEEKIKKIVDEYKAKLKDSEKIENPQDNKVLDYKIDFEDLIMQYTGSRKKYGDEEYKKVKEKFSLYPFAKFTPFVQTGSFYGRSDVESLIPIQKIINFNISMLAMSIQNNAYNKIFVKNGALQGQVITNEPGQVITDYTRGTNTWGIKMAESQPMPNGLIESTNEIFNMARTVYGFSDVMDGSITNQDISGYAVQQMIKQANSSIEQQQKIFWDFCKDKAAIRLMFYKFFVDQAFYTYELEDYEVQNLEQSRNRLLNMQNAAMNQGQSLEILQNEQGQLDEQAYDQLKTPTLKTQIRGINIKRDVYGVNFDISIDALQGTNDSKLQESQFWDNMLLNGGISNLTPDQLDLYIQANPTISQRTRDALKNVIEKQKREENTQLRNALNEAMQKLQQASEFIQQLQSQNDYQKRYTDNLTKEYSNKINAANQYLQAQQKQMQISNGGGETEGEVKSNNARGIAGSKKTSDA